MCDRGEVVHQRGGGQLLEDDSDGEVLEEAGGEDGVEGVDDEL